MSNRRIDGVTYVTGGSGPLDVDVLTSLHVVVLESGLDSESVGTEEVSLGLDEVGGEGLGPVAVEEGQLKESAQIPSSAPLWRIGKLTAVVWAEMGIPQRVDWATTRLHPGWALAMALRKKGLRSKFSRSGFSR